MLPIDVQPAVVAQALAAGKHVVSEKPIAPDVAAGRELIALQSRHAGPVWMVAENWRYDEAHEQAAALVQDGAIGRVLAVHLAQHASHSPGEKYYDTAWRRSDAFPGGYLLDAGVHYVAVLRMIAGEITAVSAQVALLRSDLPPADSLAATLHFAGGALGVYYTGFAAASPWSAPLTVVGEQGSLRVAQNRVEMVDAAGSVATFPCRAYRGVYRELKAFAAAIRQGQPHRNSPQEGLRDVAVIEGMLEAARTERLVRLAP
jgi:predicted dehydrogenase